MSGIELVTAASPDRSIHSMPSNPSNKGPNQAGRTRGSTAASDQVSFGCFLREDEIQSLQEHLDENEKDKERGSSGKPAGIAAVKHKSDGMSKLIVRRGRNLAYTPFNTPLGSRTVAYTSSEPQSPPDHADDLFSVSGQQSEIPFPASRARELRTASVPESKTGSAFHSASQSASGSPLASPMPLPTKLTTELSGRTNPVNGRTSVNVSAPKSREQVLEQRDAAGEAQIKELKGRVAELQAQLHKVAEEKDALEDMLLQEQLKNRTPQDKQLEEAVSHASALEVELQAMSARCEEWRRRAGQRAVELNPVEVRALLEEHLEDVDDSGVIALQAEVERLREELARSEVLRFELFRQQQQQQQDGRRKSLDLTGRASRKWEPQEEGLEAQMEELEAGQQISKDRGLNVVGVPTWSADSNLTGSMVQGPAGLEADVEEEEDVVSQLLELGQATLREGTEEDVERLSSAVQAAEARAEEAEQQSARHLLKIQQLESQLASCQSTPLAGTPGVGVYGRLPQGTPEVSVAFQPSAAREGGAEGAASVGPASPLDGLREAALEDAVSGSVVRNERGSTLSQQVTLTDYLEAESRQVTAELAVQGSPARSAGTGHDSGRDCVPPSSGGAEEVRDPEEGSVEEWARAGGERVAPAGMGDKEEVELRTMLKRVETQNQVTHAALGVLVVGPLVIGTLRILLGLFGGRAERSGPSAAQTPRGKESQQLPAARRAQTAATTPAPAGRGRDGVVIVHIQEKALAGRKPPSSAGGAPAAASRPPAGTAAHSAGTRPPTESKPHPLPQPSGKLPPLG